MEKGKLDTGSIVKAAPRPGKATIASLCEHFKKAAKAHSALVRITFAWVTENIEYDVTKYYEGKTAWGTIDEVLKQGKTTCTGYCELFNAIMKELGIESVMISGFAKGLTYDPEVTDTKPNYCWNAVKLDGVWNLVDNTWGAGTISRKKFIKDQDYFYFCTEPAIFLRTHFPKEEKWQLIEPPVKREEYDKYVKCKPLFYRIGLTNIQPDNAVIECSDYLLKFRIGVTSGLKPRPCITPNLRKVKDKNDEEEIELTSYLEYREGYFHIEIQFLVDGIYNFYLFAPKKPGEKSLTDIALYRIKVKGITNPNAKLPAIYPEQFSLYHELDVVLHEPRSGTLVRGSTVNFKLSAVKTEEMVVVVGDNWTPLNYDSATGIYSESVDIDSDKVSVFYKKEGTKNYSAVISYQTIEGEEKKEKVVPVKKNAGALKECGIENIPKNGLITATKNEYVLKFDAKPNCVVMASLNNSSGEEIEDTTFVQQDDNHYEVHIGFPDNGSYQLDIFAKTQQKTISIPFALGYQFIVSESIKKQIKFPAIFAGFKSFAAFLLEPLEGTLKAGSSCHFKVKIPKAVSAAVVMGEVEIPMVEDEGKLFHTEHPVQIPHAGSVSVFASFPEEKSISALKCLLDYQIG